MTETVEAGKRLREALATARADFVGTCALAHAAYVNALARARANNPSAREPEGAAAAYDRACAQADERYVRARACAHRQFVADVHASA